MRLRRDEDSGRLDLEHLNELIVGQNSKIYKVAVMDLADDGTVIGQMVDQQNGVMYADFFLAASLDASLLINQNFKPRFSWSLLLNTLMNS
jgi:hypothetical protein